LGKFCPGRLGVWKVGTYIALSLGDLALALLLIGITIFLSYWQKLGLGRDLLVGTVRSFVQLMAVGYLLQGIFDLQKWYLVVLALFVMIAVAARTAYARQSVRWGALPGQMFVAIGASSLLTLGLVVLLILKVQPWYNPRYVIPLAGMIIGNSMTGAALVVNRLTGEIESHRGQIEVALSLGATSRQAVAPYLREALRSAMMPTVAGMMTVGIVQLPGMMTGQIIAGTRPALAVRYQVMVTYMIAAATALTTIGVALLAYSHFFTRDHQLVGVEDHGNQA